MEGPHLSDSEYSKKGTDNLRQKGSDDHGSGGLSPNDGPRDEEGSSDWKWVGPGGWQAPCQKERHELCLRKGLLCLSGTAYHRLSPGTTKPRWRLKATWPRDRQDAWQEGGKPISREQGKEQAGK